MIPWVYVGCPNPDTYEKTPFWHKPVARLVAKIINSKNPKYAPAVMLVKAVVKTAKRAKVAVLIARELMIRFGYEAFS